jgi:hypothetical protein
MWGFKIKFEISNSYSCGMKFEIEGAAADPRDSDRQDLKALMAK